MIALRKKKTQFLKRTIKNQINSDLHLNRQKLQLQRSLLTTSETDPFPPSFLSESIDQIISDVQEAKAKVLQDEEWLDCLLFLSYSAESLREVQSLSGLIEPLN